MSALKEKKYGEACSKKCMLFGVGACVHVIAALNKKGLPIVEHGLREEETLSGLGEQLAGGFPLPDPASTAKKVELLRKFDALLPLEKAPLRPKPNKAGRLTRDEEEKRATGAVEEALNVKKRTAKAVQDAIDPALSNKRAKGPQKCGYCGQAGHRKKNNKGEWKCR